MEKIILFTKSNFRKNKGTSIGLFLLMLLTSMLIGTSLLLFFDAYPSIEKEAERLNAGDGYICINADIEGIDDDFIESIMKNDTEEYDIYHLMGYPATAIPFGDGTLSPDLLISDSSTFERSLNRTEIVLEDSEITGPYIYLPYQLHSSGGVEIGDSYSFDLQGENHVFSVKGFTSTTYFGCNNTGRFEFVVDDESYDEIHEKNQDSDAILISYRLKENVKASKFEIEKIDEITSRNPDSMVYAGKLSDTLVNRGFMALILAVSMLTMMVILVFVITLMLTNCITNFINENMRTIGALKAVGYLSKDIKNSLYLWFGSLAVIGSILGAFCSYALMPVMSKIVVGQTGVPYVVSLRFDCSVIGILFVAIAVIAVTFLATKKIRKIEPIVALRDGVETHNFKKNHVSLEKTGLPLNISLSLKTLFGNVKQNLITFFVMGLLVFCCVISLLMYENFSRNPNFKIFTFEICGGILGVDKEVKDEVKEYLEGRDDVSNIRSMISLNLTYNGEESFVTYVFDDVSKMNNQEVCYEGRLPEYDNEIAISGKFAKEYGYEIGDEVTLVYGAEEYSYLITGFSQTLNNGGREVVMNFKAAEHLIDIQYVPEYFWFDSEDSDSAQKVMDDCSEKYGTHVITTQNFLKTMEGNLTTFRSISILMLVIICVISGAIILLTLYLLVKALVYRKRKEYGIYKALGYTTNSLILQTALSFMPTIIVSVIVFSVISYYAANPYMNTFMISFGLVQSHFAIPIPGVFIIACAMIIISFGFALLQARRVKDIEPYQMLVEE